MRQIYLFAIATVVVTLILIPLGGFVRQSGSGLACPDWPLCHGQVGPPLEEEGTLIEFSHRVVGLIVSLLALTVGILAIRHRRESSFILKGAVIAGVGIVAQVGLGAAVVLVELQPFLIMAHLGMALGFLATVIIISAAARKASRPQTAQSEVIDSGGKWLLGAAIAGLFSLLLLGAFAGGSGARSWCSGWPLCSGQIVPVGDVAGNWRVWVIFAHRLLTIPVAVLVFWTGWRFRESENRTVRLHAIMAAAWMLVEIGLGALNPLTSFAIGIAVAHLGVAAFIWTHLIAAAAVGLDILPDAAAGTRAR